jgi:hypothetical protein
MAKVPGFAKVYAGRWAHRRNGHQATFANAAGFFNNLLGLSSAEYRRDARLAIGKGWCPNANFQTFDAR